MSAEPQKQLGEKGALTSMYALNVLPDRTHKGFDKGDAVLDSLVYFKEELMDTLGAFSKGEFLNMDLRFLPLSPQAVRELGKLSFRKGKKVLETDWECIWSNMTEWDFFPQDDDNYGYWSIWEMEPEIPLTNGQKLYLVEIDHNFEYHGPGSRDSRQPIECFVGFMTADELEILSAYLTRFED